MNLTETEVMELQRRASARTVRADSARRARLILLLADGLTWSEIRAKLDCSDSYIDRWSKRFAADRLAGLFARHAGRERYKVTDRVEARVLARTTRHTPADGSTHWSTRKLAAELGGDISHMTVARIWAKHGIKPHRLEGYLASNDPDFETKAADVIGLYLNPPQHAAVFSVDEKTAIQALDRKDPVLPLSPGRAERHGFEYQTWFGFTLYAEGIRGALARGGTYRISDRKGGEPATGFSLYPDPLIDAVAGESAPRETLFLPLGHDPAAAARSRAEGWRTVAALSDADDARALGCTHRLEDGGAKPL